MEKISGEKSNFSELPHELKTNVEDPIKEAAKEKINQFKHNANIVRKRGYDKCNEFKDKIEDKCHELKDKIEGTIIANQSIWDGRLFKYTDLPEWMRDNEYITDMHRPQIQNIVSCLRSIFSIHSETGNIWTHLIGALIFLSLIGHTVTRPATDFVHSFQEKAVATTFYMCAFLCLSFSTTFHTLGCNSEKTCLLCGRLDYTGIAVLITGSFLPWVYYSFYCYPSTQIKYLAAITAIGTLCTCVSLMKSFALPQYRAIRGVLFIVFGLCGIAPCIHAFIINGVEYSLSHGQLQYLIIMGSLYIIGAIFFITRFPESYWPGKFNLVLQSHQLFHVLVVCAALVQVYAVKNFQHIRRAEGNQCYVTDDLSNPVVSTGEL